MDAEVLNQPLLRTHHITDGDRREIRAPWLVSLGAVGVLAIAEGPGATHAAAQDIRTDDEKAVRIDRTAGADDRLPPARLVGDRVRLRDILVPGQRMANEYRVGTVRVQGAVGTISDRMASQ